MNPKGKRSAPQSQTASKKRKLNNGKHQDKPKKVVKPRDQRKEKAADRKLIPLPVAVDEDVELSDQDMDVLDTFKSATGFLKNLDHKGIMRSKNELLRLHQLTKPVRTRQAVDDLPSVDSQDEEDDGEPWSSGLDEDLGEVSDDIGLVPEENLSQTDNSDEEMPYETVPRKLHPTQGSPEPKAIKRLPIKLRDGQIRSTGFKPVNPIVSDTSGDEIESEAEREVPIQTEDGTTGARFGRAAVVDILLTKSRKERIELAKSQIAGLCQEIIADPEHSLNLLRRLHTFSLPTISTPSHPDPVPNYSLIRQLSILSQLAIFKDIIPGYRIRALTETEKVEKVSQMVSQTREWEQGLVMTYQAYLRLLETEIKARSDLADSALSCMCTLLTEVTHFNFRVNLMTCIVARLSKKSWDKTSEMCLNALNTVFRTDLTGVPSLEIVRLLNRMIKERHFKVHPNVLSCLLHLRLRTELGVRASDKQVDRPQINQSKKGAGKKADRVHLSKKAKKVLKERKEIDKDLREAEAVVDQEERKATQTETLKLLFVLYFRILKNPTPTPLLPQALSGVSRFAHLVNIDFFKDLLGVLKDLISIDDDPAFEGSDTESGDPSDTLAGTSRCLMCISTAFELLSGQGEALNIDLSEFINHLYAMLLRLSMIPDLDAHQSALGTEQISTMDLLFRVLDKMFSPRTSAKVAPPWRSAAFAKRLLGSALHWPSSAVLRALDFVRALIAKDPHLEAMLSTEDRIFNGVYRPDVDDPQLCQPFQSSFWELHTLHQCHCDPRVRAEAGKLLGFSHDGGAQVRQ